MAKRQDHQHDRRHQRSAIRRRRREVGMEETDIEGLAVEPDVELEG